MKELSRFDPAKSGFRFTSHAHRDNSCQPESAASREPGRTSRRIEGCIFYWSFIFLQFSHLP